MPERERVSAPRRLRLVHGVHRALAWIVAPLWAPLAGFWLGTVRGYVVEGRAELRAGDVLLIFSDGVTETWNEEGEEFGEEGLEKLVRERHQLDATDLHDVILEELDRFEGGGGATDDRTLIVLKRH